MLTGRSGEAESPRVTRRTWLWVILVLVAAGGLVWFLWDSPCCTMPPHLTDPPDGEWALVAGTLDGQPIVTADAPQPTLSIEGESLSASAGCNGYGGEVGLGGDQFRVKELIGTLMACLDETGQPGPVMQVEARYTEALSRLTTWRKAGDTLTLSGPGVELVFSRTGSN